MTAIDKAPYEEAARPRAYADNDAVIRRAVAERFSIRITHPMRTIDLWFGQGSPEPGDYAVFIAVSPTDPDDHMGVVMTGDVATIDRDMPWSTSVVLRVHADLADVEERRNSGLVMIDRLDECLIQPIGGYYEWPAFVGRPLPPKPIPAKPGQTTLGGFS